MENLTSWHPCYIFGVKLFPKIPASYIYVYMHSRNWSRPIGGDEGVDNEGVCEAAGQWQVGVRQLAECLPGGRRWQGRVRLTSWSIFCKHLSLWYQLMKFIGNVCGFKWWPKIFDDTFVMYFVGNKNASFLDTTKRQCRTPHLCRRSHISTNEWDVPSVRVPSPKLGRDTNRQQMEDKTGELSRRTLSLLWMNIIASLDL